MKKLLYFSQQKSTIEEHEFICAEKLGYKVTVQYSKDGNYSNLSEKPVVFNNVSEVHVNYEPDKIAIESDDVHRTGRTNDWDDIDWISIVSSDKIEELFSDYNGHIKKST